MCILTLSRVKWFAWTDQLFMLWQLRMHVFITALHFFIVHAFEILMKKFVLYLILMWSCWLSQLTHTHTHTLTHTQTCLHTKVTSLMKKLNFNFQLYLMIELARRRRSKLNQQCLSSIWTPEFILRIRTGWQHMSLISHSSHKNLLVTRSFLIIITQNTKTCPLG